MARPRPPRSRSNKPLVRLFGIAIVVLATWVYGLISFADGIPNFVQAPDQKTDVIVVLTGGSGRLETGLTLLKAGMAEMLFVSGVYQGIDVRPIKPPFRPSHRARPANWRAT